MCGINGIIKKGAISRVNLLEELTQMNDLIIHRRPDDYGVYLVKGIFQTVFFRKFFRKI